MSTLKDVAEKANVSLMTVSRVVNGQFDKVSSKTREKVEKAILELQYVPNFSARALSTKDSKIVALIMYCNGNRLRDPYIAEMCDGIIDNLQKEGYYTLVCALDSPENVTKYLRTWNTDGAIFLGDFDAWIPDIKKQNHIPLIFTDSYLEQRLASNVGIDDYKGGVLAANHFLSAGHVEFAFVSFEENGPKDEKKSSQVMKKRLQGFRDTLGNNGFFLKDSHCFLNLPPEKTAKQLKKLLPSLTAVFVCSDQLAISVMGFLQELDVSIPEDISVIGFDNTPSSSIISPKLTTVAQNIMEKAAHTSKLLLNQMEKNNLSSLNIILDVELLPRDSVKKIEKKR
ncbi:MAG: LacI family DNA-binding transcriptional regulator [Eubacteriales bacterium]